MATTALRRRIEIASPTRQRVIGLVLLGLAFGIWIIFARQVTSDQVTTFSLTLGGSDVTIPDWVLPSSFTLNVLALAAALLGGIQLARGFGRQTTVVLGIVSGLFIFGFLTWAAAGQSLNLLGLLTTSLVKAVPITLGAMSGVLCERAGGVKIALEGVRLPGAGRG